MIKIISIFLMLVVAGCSSLLVNKSDLDAWVDVSVEALDVHSFFITIPVIKTVTESGVEIRDYVNKEGISSCMQNGFGTRNSNVNAIGNNASVMTYANYNTFQNCSSQIVGCDNIFYIRDGKVLEYKPVGRCITNSSVRPEVGWERFSKRK